MILAARKLHEKQKTSTGKMKGPAKPAVKERSLRSAKASRTIHGQMLRRTVGTFGSGSDLLFGRKMRKALWQRAIRTL